MRESAIPNAGWGMFTLKSIHPNTPVKHGEVTIQIPDVTVKYRQDWQVLLDSYPWLAHGGGGVFDGSAVHSAMPAVGALANGHSDLFNVVRGKPEINHGGVTRRATPFLMRVPLRSTPKSCDAPSHC